MTAEYAPLRFVSLFSGVGGFDLGLEAAGWRCVAQVEWDKNCQQVLARHWPDVPRWSDVADVNGADLPPADVVAFGSPCQDLSVAGKRAGFNGKRSVLFYEATRIIREMRDATDNVFPRLVIWENVAGALSSSGGRDFAAVLDELADLGAVDICWRVLDARWFGVPQRRRRVFVVADFAGQRAAAVLPESPSVPWHPRTGFTAGQGTAAGTGSGADGGGLGQNARDLHLTVESEHTHTHTSQHSRAKESAPVALTTIRPRQATLSPVAATLNSGGNSGGFRTEPGEHLVVVPGE